MAIDPDRIAELVATCGDVAATLLRIAVDGMDQLERDTELDRLQRRAAAVLKSTKWLADGEEEDEDEEEEQYQCAVCGDWVDGDSLSSDGLCKSCNGEWHKCRKCGDRYTATRMCRQDTCSECSDKERESEKRAKARTVPADQLETRILNTLYDGDELSANQICEQINVFLPDCYDRVSSGQKLVHRLLQLEQRGLVSKRRMMIDGKPGNYLYKISDNNTEK